MTILNHTHGSSHVLWQGMALLKGRIVSLDEINQAQRLDTTSKIIALNVGNIHLVRDEPDEAIRLLNDLLRRHPTYPHAYFAMGNAYVNKSQFVKAVENHEQAVRHTNGAPINRAALAFSLASTGEHLDRSESKSILADLTTKSESAYVSSTALAIAHIGLENLDAAFDALNMAADERDVGLPYHIRTSLFDRIRNDARYKRLMQRMNLLP